VRAKLREIAEGSITDPRRALTESVGDISGFVLQGQRILVATYIRPAVSKGGVHMPDRTLAEDRYQGKVGLVVKVGQGIPEPPLYSVGDWVTYRASDGFEMFFVDANGLDGTPCRVLDELSVIGTIDDPAKIW
jgi:co-chaperonin GroES (HSP10)